MRVVTRSSRHALRPVGQWQNPVLVAAAFAAEALESRVLLSTTNSWKAAVSGDFDDASKWSLGHVPTATEDAVVSVIGTGLTITHNTSAADAVHSLVSNQPFTLSSGSMAVGTTIEVDNTFTLSGGTLRGGTDLPGSGGQGLTGTGGTLDGVTVNGSFAVSGTVYVSHDLTLNGTATLGSATGTGVLSFTDAAAQTLGGAGTVVLGGYNYYLSGVAVATGLTIGSGVAVRGQNGFVGYDYYGGGSARATLTNLGTIAADVSGGTISVTAAGGTNTGTVSASAGAKLNLPGAFGAPAGGTLSLGGGGTVVVSGTAANETIAIAAGTTATLNYATLDGVTVNGSFAVSGTVYVSHDLTLNGTATLGSATGTGVLSFTDAAAQTLGGAGTVVLGGYNYYLSGVAVATGLTIGSGVAVRGQNGFVGYDYYGGGSARATLTNLGTIAADVSGGTISVTAAGGTNTGTVSASAGAKLNLPGAFGAPAGGTLSLGGGGTVVVSGTAANETIAIAAGTTATLNYATLDGVTVNGSFAVSGTVYVSHDLTLNGTATLGSATGTGVLSFTDAAAQTLGGAGTVVLGGYNYYLSGVAVATGLTIGSGVAVRGQNGFVGYDYYGGGSARATLTNLGTIAADVSGGTITLYGSTISNSEIGPIVGTLASTGSVTLNNSGFLAENLSGSASFGGDVLGNTTDGTLWNAAGTTNLTGTGTAASPQRIEVMGQNLGATAAGFAHNFAYSTLNLGYSNYVKLVNLSSNTGSPSAEALYVNTLVIPSGSTLDLNGLKVYARVAQLSGTVLNGTITQLPTGGGSLDYASPTPGTIASGTSDNWTIFGRAGGGLQAIVDPGSGAAGGPVSPTLGWAEVQVLDPNGVLVAKTDSTAAGPAVALSVNSLPSDGTYTIQVHATPGHSVTGHYVLSAYNATPNVQSLSLNQAVVGTIGSAYGLDQWTFAATANTQVQFQLAGGSATGLGYTLTGPGGTAVFTNATASSSLLNLPTAGTYTLTVQGLGGQTGRYGFTMAQTSVTNLALATAYTGVAAGSGQAQLFAVPVTEANPLTVILGDGNAADHNEVYVRFGQPPTRETYDYGVSAVGASHSILVPQATPGTWYVLVYNESVATAPGSFTLQANSSKAVLTSTTPSTGASNVPTTFTLTGGGFLPGTVVNLVAGNSTVYPAATTSVDLPTQLTATFAAGTVPAGTYAVQVHRPDGATVQLAAAFTMVQTGVANLKTHVEVPNPIGNHIAATLYVDYTNTGTVAMPAPLLTLGASRPSGNGAYLTLDSTIQTSGFWTSATPAGYSNTVQILASGATPGVLQPGESARVPVYYGGWVQSQWFSNPITFSLTALQANDTTAVNWSTTLAGLQPASIGTAAWSAISANLVAKLGSTAGGYVQMLDGAATYLGRLGDNVTDVQSLWGFELQQANAGVSAVGPTLTTATDDTLLAPGTPITITRSAANTITGRNTPGLFGYGWSTPWETAATVAADGTFTIVGPGGSRETFQPDSRYSGAYFSATGDHNKLTADGTGGYRLTSPSGGVTDFASNGKLAYVQDLNGNRITAGYTGGRLTSLTHSSGQSVAITYNAAGLIYTVADSAGRTTTYTYDAAGQLSTVTDFASRTTTYGYAATTGPAAHALATVTSNGGLHSYYTYDVAGRLSGTHGDNNAAPLTYGYAEGAVTTTDGVYDLTAVYFDQSGQPAKTVDGLGNATYATYDAYFNLVKTTGPTGLTQTYTYDGLGNVTSSTDALGATTQFTYGANSRLTLLTDAKGNPTSYAYNANGDLYGTTYADNTKSSSTFYPLGQPKTFLNQNGQTIGYTYNAAGQLATESFSDGTSYTYTYDAHGNLKTAVDATGTTTFDYYANDTLKQVTYPGNLWLAFTYNADGQRTQMVDQTGFTTNYTYDAAGRLWTLTDGTGAAVVTYTYDAAGRLKTKVNGNGTSTTYDYYADGSVQHLVNLAPDGTTVNSRFDYTYDPTGNVAAETTVDGAWAYTYDGNGQLTHAVFTSTNAAVPSQDLAYAYDAVGNRTSTTINGVTTVYVTNNVNEYTSVGGVTATYNARGDLIAFGPNTYNYDPSGDIISIMSATQNIYYTWDALGQRLSSSSGGITNQYLLDPTGAGEITGGFASSGSTEYRYGLGLTGQSFAGGTTSFYDFDASWSTADITGAGGTLSSRFSYLPFGEDASTPANSVSLFSYIGRGGITADASGLDGMRAREYVANWGRFSTVDPLGINGGSSNLYEYGLNNPLRYVDPSGHQVQYYWYDGSVFSPHVEYTASDGGKVVFGFYNGGPDETYGFSLGVSDGISQGVFLGGSDSLGKGYTLGWSRGPFSLGLTADLASVGLSSGLGFTHSKGSTYGLLLAYAPPPSLSGSSAGSTDTVSVGSQDPNAKTGPAGFGTAGYVSGAAALFPYKVEFENAKTATAPAQQVTVTDQLSTNLDWSTFQLTQLGFGDFNVVVPAGSQSFQTTVSVTYGGQTFSVLVSAGIHSATGQVYANFYSVDPLTGLPPSVLVGFLPPEDGTGRGQGYFSYTVAPRAGLSNGTAIPNVARISFDGQPVITTDQVDDEDPSKGTTPTKAAMATIDSAPPTSTVAALPPSTTTASFAVAWAGQDVNGSGVAAYTIYVSDNGGPFTPWLTGTTLTTATYAGAVGHTYGFYTVATDNVGNVQPTPAGAQATTVSIGNAQPLTLSGPAYYLKLDADGQHVDVWANATGTGSPSQSVLLSGVSAVSDTGASLTVDFSAGDPLPASGLTFTGTAGATLAVVGTAGNDTVVVNGTTVAVSAAFGSATLTYSNVAAISFAGGTGADMLTQAAQPGGGATLAFVGPTTMDSLVVNGGRFTFPAGAAGSKIQTITLGSLSVGAGATVAVAPSNGHPNRAVLVLGGLTVGGSASNPTGRLDLADNDLVLRNGTLATVAGLARSGFAGGTWAGPGLASSAAAADSTHLTAVGVILNAATDGSPLWGAGTGLGLFDGVDTSATDVLVKYTYYGDANLDGATNAADYTRLDAGFVLGRTGWANGDSNYDGVVDGSDYALTDNAFNAQQVPLSAISPVLTLAAVPGGLAYDGTNDVATWAVSTLTGIAGHPAPTGTPVVRFYAGSTATGTLLAYPPVLPGTYTVVASYVGDNVYAAAATAPVTFTVAKATPTLTLTLTPGPAVVRYDGTADVTAWAKAVLLGVTNATGPTGAATVVFYAGSSATGTPLSAPPVAAGTYTAVATYAGDTLYLPAASAPFTFTVSATSGSTPLLLPAASAYYLRLDADGQHLDVWANVTGTGTPAQSVLLSTTSSIGVTGAATGTTVVVDLAGGNPLVASGLTFTGVAGAANVLTVTDVGDAGNAAFAATADTVYVTAGAAALMPLTYANLSAVNVIAGSGTDTLAQLAQPGGGATSLSFTGTTAADSLTVNAGTFTYPAAGSYVLNGLTIAAGAKVVMAAPATPAARSVLVIRNLKVATDASGAWAGTLDLAGNDLIVKGGSLATVTSLAAGGFANGLWTGPGLANTAAAADPRHRLAVGIAQNLAADGTSPLYTSFDGQAVAAADVLVRSTAYGDLNLDGVVNTADYTRLDSGFVARLTGWSNGDVNYDGIVDGTDYTLVDNAFNAQG